MLNGHNAIIKCGRSFLRQVQIVRHESEISGQEVSEANTKQQYLHPLNEILITLNRSIGYAYRSIDYV